MPALGNGEVSMVLARELILEKAGRKLVAVSFEVQKVSSSVEHGA